MEWDEVLGKHVLFGLTYLDENGNVARQEQKHGVIIRADDEGVTVRLAGTSGDEMWLPPDRDALEPAVAGEYRLRQTGEVVVDPDLIATWTIEPGS